MKWWPTACRPGDMIRVRIREGIWHYGIFAGEQEVIQFGPPPRGKPVPAEDVRVCTTTIDEFAGDGFVETARFSLAEKIRKNRPETTVRIARESIGEGGYDLLKNNCEHFATRCCFGKGRSEQAEKVLREIRETEKT